MFVGDWVVLETIMIENGLYSLNASSRDGSDEVGGVLILRDGQLHGGDAYVFYTGSYECSAGNWQGKHDQSRTLISTGRRWRLASSRSKIADLHRCRCKGRCDDSQLASISIRYEATLRLLGADSTLTALKYKIRIRFRLRSLSYGGQVAHPATLLLFLLCAIFQDDS